ncbi:MAG TPA: MMPL family transporter, partial [Blastocatellia bacterium]
MIWILRFSVRNPWLILATVTVITLSSCLFIPRVRLQLDGRSLIPEGNESLKPSDDASALFGLRDVVVVGVANEGSGIYNPETLSRVARLSDNLSRTDGIIASSVKSLATLPRLFVEEGVIDTRPLLAPGVTPSSETVRRISYETHRMGLNNDMLVSRDGRAAIIFAEAKPGANRYALLEQVRSLVAKEQSGEDKVYLSGTALAQAVLGTSAARDLARLIPAVIIVLGGVLMIGFRHPVPAIISLIEIGASLIWTIGILGLTGQSVFVTTLVLPVILIAVGVSDDVYALTHYFNEAGVSRDSPLGDVIVASFKGVIRPIILTAISTIIGLLSLAATSLQPLRVFGIFGAVAIVISGLFTFTLVPALLKLINPQVDLKKLPRSARQTKWLLELFRSLMTVSPARILLGILLFAIAAGLVATRVRVDDSWVKNLPPASDISRGDESLNNLFAGTITVDLMINSQSAEGFLQPETFLALGKLEDALAVLPSVGAVYSLYSEIMRIKASLKGVPYDQYRRAFEDGNNTLSRDDIEQSLLLLSSVGRTQLNNWFDNGYQRARVTVFIRSANYDRINRVLKTGRLASSKILPAGGDITPFGDGWVSYVTVQLLVIGQVYSIGAALLTDLCLLSLLMKSARAGLIAILPAAFSVLVVFAALAVAQTPLGIANSMFAGIAIGIGLDFSIHLTAAFRQSISQGLNTRASLRRAFRRTGPAIVISVIAISSGFSVLALSEVAPNVQLALMVCL